jgi:DNA-binding response OmpR family regulator
MINFYDVIILDINLPEKNWLELCKQLREKWKQTPILFLTSRSTKEDIIKWLDLWADDYLTKPFDYDELLARLKTLSRRNLINKSNTKIFIDDYVIDIQKKAVLNKDNQIKLTHLEYNLFLYLAQNRWKVLSRKQLYENVWWEFDGDFMFSKTVDVYIWYLRKKISKSLIKTKKGFWYCIN